MHNEEIIENLETLPDKIMQKEFEIRDKIKDIEGDEGTLRVMSRTCLSEVHAEVDDDGKDKFSNKEKRTDETDRRLRANEQYQSLLTKIKKTKDGIEMEKILLKNLERKFRSRVAITRLTGNY